MRGKNWGLSFLDGLFSKLKKVFKSPKKEVFYILYNITFARRSHENGRVTRPNGAMVTRQIPVL